MSLAADLRPYRWRRTLLVSLALAALVLSFQFPAPIYSPDVSFHAAKILRAASGDFFNDPFTGTPTIYPSFFHFFFGLLSRVLQLDSLHTIRLVVMLDFLGLFAALYYLARAFFPNADGASLCVLSVPLVFSSPTGRYILLAQPSCFAYVFLIFGLGACYRYLSAPTLAYAGLAGGLLGLAANIWWTNVLVVVPIVALLGGYAIVRGLRSRLSHVALFVVALALPWTYTAWELWSVRDILPHLGRPSGGGGFLDRVAVGITAFLTKGNLQFVDAFAFWDLGNAPVAGSRIPGGVQLLHALAQLRPLLLPGAAVQSPSGRLYGVGLGRQRTATSPITGIVGTLPWAALLVLVCSFAAPDRAHMRRVQFIVYILLLIFAYKTFATVLGSARLRRAVVLGVCAASLVSLAYTVVYSSRLFASGIPPTDREIVAFIEKIPNHGEERIFMLGDSLRRVAPFVTFRSFVDLRQGLYYWQDPVTAAQLYGDFLAIRDKRDDWSAILRARGICLMIFRVSVPAELEVFRQYQPQGLIRLQNRDWVVLEIPA